jgi:hypothetical protein
VGLFIDAVRDHKPPYFQFVTLPAMPLSDTYYATATALLDRACDQNAAFIAAGGVLRTFTSRRALT